MYINEYDRMQLHKKQSNEIKVDITSKTQYLFIMKIKLTIYCVFIAYKAI